MYPVLADVCSATDSKLLFCFSQKWYVVFKLCLVVLFTAYGKLH